MSCDNLAAWRVGPIVIKEREPPKPKLQLVVRKYPKIVKITTTSCLCPNDRCNMRLFMYDGLYKISKRNPRIHIGLTPRPHELAIIQVDYSSGHVTSVNVRDRTNKEIVQAIKILAVLPKYVPIHEEKYRQLDCPTLLELQASFVEPKPEYEPVFRDDTLTEGDFAGIRSYFKKQDDKSFKRPRIRMRSI